MIFSEFMTLKIKDLMQKDVVTVTTDQPVEDAVQAMVTHDIGSVVVLKEKGNNVVGILTERDLMTRVVAKGLDLKKTLVGDVMTEVPATLTSNLPVVMIFSLFKAQNFRHVPIVDKDKLVGIISIKDVFKLMHKTIGDVIFGEDK